MCDAKSWDRVRFDLEFAARLVAVLLGRWRRNGTAVRRCAAAGACFRSCCSPCLPELPGDSRSRSASPDSRCRYGSGSRRVRIGVVVRVLVYGFRRGVGVAVADEFVFLFSFLFSIDVFVCISRRG